MYGRTMKGLDSPRSLGTLQLSRLAIVPALGAVAMLMAACGGGGTAAAKGSTSTTSRSASFAAYRTCLSQHGVTLPSFPRGTGTSSSTPPSGGFPGGGFGGAGALRNNPKFASAAKACNSLRPSGGFGRSGFNSAAFDAYRNCLKLHGVTLPSGGPGSSTSGVPSVPPTTFDTSNPTFQAAESACAALRPSFGSTTTTTSPSSSG